MKAVDKVIESMDKNPEDWKWNGDRGYELINQHNQVTIWVANGCTSLSIYSSTEIQNKLSFWDKIKLWRAYRRLGENQSLLDFVGDQ